MAENNVDPTLFQKDFEEYSITDKNVQFIYIGASHVGNKRLQVLSMTFLKRLTMNNVWDRLTFAQNNKLEELLQSVYEFLNHNLHQFQKSIKWVELIYVHVKHLVLMEICSDTIRPDILMFVIEWVKYTVERQHYLLDLIEDLSSKLETIDEEVLEKISQTEIIVTNPDCRILMLQAVVSRQKKIILNLQIEPKSNEDGSQTHLLGDLVNKQIVTTSQTSCSTAAETSMVQEKTATEIRTGKTSPVCVSSGGSQSYQTKPKKELPSRMSAANSISPKINARTRESFDVEIKKRKMSNESRSPEDETLLGKFYGFSMDANPFNSCIQRQGPIFAYFTSNDGDNCALLSYNLETYEVAQEIEAVHVGDGESSLLYDSQEIYFFGGAKTSTGISKATVLNSVRKYSLKTKKWLDCNSMAEPRCHFHPVLLNRKVFAVGGAYEVTNSLDALAIMDAAELLDLDSEENWDEMEFPVMARADYGIVAIKNIIYLVGGYSSGFPEGADKSLTATNRIVVTSTVEAYDIRTNSWSFKSPIPIPLVGASVLATMYGPNAYIYVFGGVTTEKGARSKRAFVYCPQSDNWHELAQMCEGRKFASSVVYKKHIYVIGGGGGGSGKLPTIELYDVAKNCWELVSPSNLPRSGNYKYIAFSQQ